MRMQKNLIKLLSLALVVCMVFSMSMSIWVSAAEATTTKAGVSTALTVKASQNEGVGYDIKGYNVSKNGTNYIYLFMPNKADLSKVTVSFSDSSSEKLDLTNPVAYTFDSGVHMITAMQSDIPTLHLDIDESKGSIDAMNNDPAHEVKCSGKMLLDVPTALAESNGWATSYTDSSVTVKGRGNTTWGLPKKPYQIKLGSKQDILGMGKSKTWILLANYGDRSLIRNKLAYDLADDLGLEATPQSEFVDVFMNGQYLGNYILCEKVEVGDNRVEITDLEDAEPDADVSGGYLLEYDRLAYSEATWINGSKTGLPITVKSPEVATADQKSYIQTYVNDMENAIYGANGYNDKNKHYTAYMDSESFNKLYWINEIFKNGDYSQGSTYMYKDKGADKLMYGGPVWDFDITLANATANAGSPTEELQQNLANPEGWWLRTVGSGFQKELFKHEDYRLLSKQIYDDVVSGFLKALPAKSDEYSAQIRKSADMNFVRWDVLNTPHQWQTPNTATTYEGEVSFVKDYLQRRSNWIDFVMNDEHFLTGNGTMDSPYLINTVADLQLVGQSFNAGSPYTGAYFKQTSDIDLKDLEWTPIGTDSNPFTGNYDGGNHKISNLNIATVNNTGAPAGLFGIIDHATIKNVQIASGNLTVTAQDAGAVVGRMRNSKVYNCSSNASVTNLASTGHQMIGGIIGHAVAGTTNTIANCYNSGTISAPNAVGGASCRGVGGVVGHLSGTSKLFNSYNVGVVTAKFGLAGYVGGLTGEQSSTDSEIQDCYWLNSGANGITQGKGAKQGNGSGEGTVFHATGMDETSMKAGSFIEILNNNRTAAATALGVDVTDLLIWTAASNSFPGLVTEWPPIINKAELISLINSTVGYQQADYTVESWSVFATALATANDVKDNQTATQNEVNNAKDALRNAIDSLVPMIPPTPGDPNKTILNMVIAYAETAKASDEYTNVIPSVKMSFDKALDTAKLISETPTATQSEIESAWITLMTEIHKLGFVAGNKTALQLVYNGAIALNQDLYQDGIAKDNFNAAIFAAQKVLNDVDAMQNEINKVEQDLTLAANALIVKNDKSQIKLVIDKAVALDMDLLIISGQDAFATAYQAAVDVYNNPNATQDQIDQAANNLLTAMLNLRYKADKSTLEQILKQAETIDLSLYTEATATAFKQALDQAQKAYADPSLTKEDAQSQVDQLAEMLKTSMNDLVLRETSDASNNSNIDAAGTTQPTNTATSPTTADHSTLPLAVAVSISTLAVVLYLQHFQKRLSLSNFEKNI